MPPRHAGVSIDSIETDIALVGAATGRGLRAGQAKSAPPMRPTQDGETNYGAHDALLALRNVQRQKAITRSPARMTPKAKKTKRKKNTTNRLDMPRFGFSADSAAGGPAL